MSAPVFRCFVCRYDIVGEPESHTCPVTISEKRLQKEVRKLRKVARAVEHFFNAPLDLACPGLDVWGQVPTEEDCDAPLWTETGLYGRVGKDAARALLSRKRDVDRMLQLWKSKKGTR